MTRTERSAYPRALVRDRSQSRSGLDNHIRKGGGGRYNWGKIEDEGSLEAAAVNDQSLEFVEELEVNDGVNPRNPALDRTSSSLSEQEIEQARQIRKNALKGQGVDLATIARTSSAVSASPPGRFQVVSTTETSSAIST
ncbi:hypothetical protein V8B97DRAFT_1943382 [Scleroderma yunnanense]